MDKENLNKEDYERMSKEKMMYWISKQKSKKVQDVASAEALSRALQDEELMKHTASIMRKMCDGEPVNVNPLTEMPEPEMRLYFICGNYFQTVDELLHYCRVNDLSTNGFGILEYYRNLAGRSDVIRESNATIESLYTAVDEDGYGIYNHERSVYRGEFIWEYNHGSLREMYSVFRDRGIAFEDDLYTKIDERYQNILKYCRKDNLFNTGKNN